jgi:hypothetical protein
MRYRRLSETGDYTFGGSAADFLTGSEAVGQACKTRVEFQLGTWWRDLEDGTPWYQEILGQRGSEKHIDAVNSILFGRIKGTRDVDQILGYNTVFDSQIRRYTWTCRVQAEYSETVVTGAV